MKLLTRASLALGLLAAGPKPYDDVVFAVRHFVSRMSGPSLDLMGESIELLRYEGLVAGEDSRPLSITEDGRAVLNELLRANVRAGTGAMNDLVIALKIRFLHLLPDAEKRARADYVLDTGTSIEETRAALAKVLDRINQLDANAT